MSSAVNEPQDPIDTGSVIGEDAEPYPGFAGDDGSDDAPLSPPLAAGESPYPADVAGTVRPLGEVGVLPLGGELDPIDSAEQPIGEVGQLPGIPLKE